MSNFAFRKSVALPAYELSEEEKKRERERVLKQTESALTQQAREWNDAQGITNPSMTPAERVAALKAHCKRLNAMPAVAQTSPKAWAYKIMSDLADGVLVDHQVAKMAKEVVGVKNEEV